MYDPRYIPQRTYPFPDPNDPRIWAEVAARTGIPPMQYQPSPQEGFYVIPSSADYPEDVWQGEATPVVEGWLVLRSDASNAMERQTPTEIYSEHSSSARFKLGGMEQIILWLLAILVIAPMVSTIVMSSNTPAGPPNTGYSLYGNPSITGSFIEKVLDHYGSPAAGQGQQLYDLGVQYKVDPAFALGFFMQESTFGTSGVARVTRSLGNLRCIQQYSCYHDPANDGDYASFSDWSEGFEAWYILLTGPIYKGSGLTTIDQITTKYAPNQDHNNPSSYACFVKYAADTWRSGIIEVGTPPRSYCVSKS